LFAAFGEGHTVCRGTQKNERTESDEKDSVLPRTAKRHTKNSLLEKRG